MQAPAPSGWSPSGREVAGVQGQVAQRGRGLWEGQLSAFVRDRLSLRQPEREISNDEGGRRMPPRLLGADAADT